MISIAFIVILVTAAIQAQNPPPENLQENPCHSNQRCEYCLHQAGCAWCMQESFPRGFPRCDHVVTLLAHGCSLQGIMNVTSTKNVVQNDPFSTASDSHDRVVQLRPQKLDVKLRPGEPITLNISFRQAANYPVDLYYLMDLTYSMKEHKEKLSELADVLAASMKNITTNFRLGFGSFIDKVVMPYADMVPDRLKNPCRDYPCIPPYGFRNHLPLDISTAKFREEVANANLSGNLDNAEGGFDAIMQTVVCKRQIGWNIHSRKIVLFATDSIFHQAGDGKLGGVVKANDGLCHLDSLGYYTESIYQDYPTLSQLNAKVTESKTNVLFAVPKLRVPLYETLSSLLEGAYAAELSKDSSNIVDLIREQYNKIRSEVKLNDNSDKPVKISYFSKCLGDTRKETNSCAGLQIGDTVSFEVKVELTNCPENSTVLDQVVTIYPVGLGEMVTLNLKFLCECDCQKNVEKNSPSCNSSGLLVCGICDCNHNSFGRYCECTGNDAKRVEKMALCNSTKTSQLCSGLGDCVCGKCECFDPRTPGTYVYGEFCECNSQGCAKDDKGLVCGGRGRGKCCEDKCICQEGYSGEVCDCNEDQSTCISPDDEATGRLCSGRGKCKCGKCKCNKDKQGIYGGEFCQDCSTCEGRCDEFRPCVECTAHGTGQYSKAECKSNCSSLAIIMSTVEAHFEPGRDEKRCLFRDSQDCTFEFFYSYNSENSPYVLVRRHKECLEKANVLAIVLGTVGGVFFLGIIILLIVRLCLYLKDKKDYERFEAEVKKVNWKERLPNPIYKEATSKFQNPMYKQE